LTARDMWQPGIKSIFCWRGSLEDLTSPNMNPTYKILTPLLTQNLKTMDL